ncbi:hypothetical protein CFAEC_11005 [Corynebacterium faecale]|uniref:CAP domain-containing protein n=1 Tax=Corynebacterium faecale TaxID=1758466 RepID=UPI0025B56C6C|nr:CAP domain-containing protein [Corynebacterium faecale]WJY93007.1 hypothetical protein CFAEC_11005 [Corynebacterium faecale]
MMRDLNTEITAIVRKMGLANGNPVETLSRLVPVLSVVLTLIITVATVLTGLDDSDDAGPDEPPIVVPVVNEQMRTDLVRAINYHRIVPASFNLELHASAQEKATDNATGGRLGTATAAESQIVMLQARQSTDIASVDGFLTMWMEDYPNYEVLMHEDNESFGVGIAEANGQTYAVVQFMQR